MKPEVPGSKEINTILGTNEVSNIFRSAAALVTPGDHMEDTHILAAILADHQTRGHELLRHLTLGRLDQLPAHIGRFTTRVRERSSLAGHLELGGNHIAVDQTVINLLDHAAVAQKEKAMRTDDLVRAAFSVPDAYLEQAILALTNSRIDRSAADLQSRSVTTRERGEQAIQLTVIKSDQSTANTNVAETTSELPIEDIIDVLSRAKTKDLDVPVVSETWTKLLLEAVTNGHRVVIAEDYERQGYDMIHALAGFLAQDEPGLFSFKSIVVPDEQAMLNEPLQTIQRAINQAEEGILFIPHAHEVLDVTTDTGKRVDQMLRRAGKSVTVVASLSDDELLRQQHTSWLRPYKKVLPESPTTTEIVDMVTAIKDELAAQLSSAKLKITITDESIRIASELAHRYLRAYPAPQNVIDIIRKAVLNLKLAHSPEKMRRLGDKRVPPDASIDPSDIEVAVEQIAKVPVARESLEKYKNMAAVLGNDIIGQPEAIDAVTRVVQRAKAGLNDPKKPIGSFIFLGPTGVGKTELAKTLARFLFDSEEALTRIDMSSYMQEHSVSTMIGAPKGYKDAESGGELTEAVRKRPYQVVVFDEIEKGHPSLMDLLLQVTQEGELKDGRGRLVDFRNTIIILTSNIGAEHYFSGKFTDRQDIEAAVLQALDAKLRPEFLNRLDKKVVFRDLKPDSLPSIVDIQMRKLNKILAAQNISVEVTVETRQHLAQVGYEPGKGARPLTRKINELINDRIAEGRIDGTIQPGDKLIAELRSGEIVLTKTK